jgi:precorrin-8X/cobalt-precorrin-8 methylmutase
MKTKSRGYAIEAESFRIVEEEMGEHAYSPLEFPLVRRVIHATADFEVGNSLIFSEGAVQGGMEAIREGSPIITDINMVASGISRIGMERLGGGEVLCRIADPEVQKQSDALGVTRSAAAMRSFGSMIARSVVVIGNAPTALREVLRMREEDGITPGLLIAVPVGFVDAAESKEALAKSDLTYITNRGRKGGTPVAVSLMNALIRLALESMKGE